MEDRNIESRMGKRRKRFRYGRAITVFIVLILLVSGVYSVLQYQAGYNLAKENAIEETDFTGDEKDAKYMHMENILIVGVDDDGSGKSRSDTMMLLSYNSESDKIKIVSFMRDIYAEIPGYKSYKLNTAYYLDGIQLLKDTITGMFGIPIHHYAVIDFDSFESLVDIAAPNGIEMEVEKEMSEKIGVTLMPGVHNLTGEELLGYARFRADREGDFGRVERQQKVIEALKDELISPSKLTKLPKLAGAAKGYIQTDLTTFEEIQIATKMITSGGIEIEKMTIPIEHSYSFTNYEHAGSVIELNVEENKVALSEFLGIPIR